MSIPAITRRMLERLPPAWQEGPNIRTLMGTLASEIGLGEAGTVALLRSRHVGTAADWGSGDPASSELGRLGALVGLRPDPDGTLVFETHDPDGVKIIFRQHE